MDQRAVLVSFTKDIGKQYAYLSDLNLAIGDKVVVPMGKDNKEMVVYVTNPTPSKEETVYATKKILRRV